jgi:hypothetical protein
MNIRVVLGPIPCLLATIATFGCGRDEVAANGLRKVFFLPRSNSAFRRLTHWPLGKGCWGKRGIDDDRSARGANDGKAVIQWQWK